MSIFTEITKQSALIREIFRQSQAWLDYEGPHAVLVSEVDGKYSLTPIGLDIIQSEMEEPELLNRVQSYDPANQVVLLNEGGTRCATLSVVDMTQTPQEEEMQLEPGWLRRLMTAGKRE